jgi:hypothetical protein
LAKSSKLLLNLKTQKFRLRPNREENVEPFCKKIKFPEMHPYFKKKYFGRWTTITLKKRGI